MKARDFVTVEEIKGSVAEAYPEVDTELLIPVESDMEISDEELGLLVDRALTKRVMEVSRHKSGMVRLNVPMSRRW